MNKLTLSLAADEINFILQVLGELPSKTGAWPLIVNIKEQAETQVKESE